MAARPPKSVAKPCNTYLVVNNAVVWFDFHMIHGKPLIDALELLLAAAKKATPSPEQQEEQRRSFAYGNTAFENALITREMVDKQAEAIAREQPVRHEQ